MKRLLTAAAAIIVLGGCGTTESAPEPGVSPSAPPPSSSSPEQEIVSVDIVIDDGEVTPLGKEVQARVGQPIVLTVTSDVADELHVHAQPEHTFDVEAAADQTFEFTVEVPGQVAVELHHLGLTPVEFIVRP